MTQAITLYHRTALGAVKIWSLKIEADGVTLTTHWGLQNGAVQRTQDVAQANSFKSAITVAFESFERKVKAKIDEGYVENIVDVIDSIKVGTQSLAELFSNPPKQFAPAKPITKIDHKLATQLDKDRKLVIQRKRDGMRHYIFVSSTEPRTVKIYTRGMDDVSSMFPDLVSYLKDLLPSGTVIDAEFIVDDKGADDFRAVSSICRSLDGRAIFVQQTVNWSFMAFDLLYHLGAEVYKQPYHMRLSVLRNIIEMVDDNRLTVVEVLPHSFAQACGLAKKNGWEGLVVWRTDQATDIQFNGSPKRVNCYKVKFEIEEDFVALRYALGTGRLSHVVGKLDLAQYRNGVLTPCGSVGTGFDNATRGEALSWAYPVVVQVKYAERTPDGNLRFPSFQRLRTDKKTTECVFEGQ